MIPKRKTIVTELEGFQSREVLSEYHTIDLLYLLHYMRKERSLAYRQMNLINKVQNKSTELKAGSKEGFNYYSEVKEQVKMLELLLTFRLGYKPEKVTFELIHSFEEAYLKSIC